MGTSGYVDLAVALEHNTGAKHLVICPAFRAKVGGIVEFEAESCMNLGRIASVMTVELGSNDLTFAECLMESVPCYGLWDPVEAAHETS